MKRRKLIKTALSLPLIPYGISTAIAAVSDGKPVTGDTIFYDERFPEARRLAEQWAPAGFIMPVQGDMTGIWNDGLKHACRQSPLTLHGVTTESFHFCLEIMLRSHVVVETRITRIDRDLHRWTMRSYNKPLTG